MATVTINDASLTAIADAIRDKLEVETTYKPSQMAAAIESISGTDLTSADEGKVVVESSGEYVLQAQTSRSISQNGTYDTTTNDEVVVDVSGGGSGNLYTNYEVSERSMYTFDTAGETLCKANGRGYYKTTDDMAYGCYPSVNSGPPFLISTVQDAVKYRADSGGPFNYGTSFQYNGETWYVSAKDHGFSGSIPKQSGPLPIYTFSQTSDRAAMGLEFLEYVMTLSTEGRMVYRTTFSEGVIEPPDGYDGFGPIFLLL